jgi:hypothetical protein
MTEPYNAYQLAAQLVNTKFQEAMERLVNTRADLNTLLSELASYASTLKPINTDIVMDEIPGLNVNPNDFTAQRPVKPDFSSNFPTAPEQAPYQNLNLDDIEEPHMDDLVQPILNINPGDNSYTSPLLESLRRKLRDWVEDGGMALPAEREADFWNRNYERDMQANRDAKDSIASDWAKKSFPMPNGLLIAAQAQADITFRDKRNDTSRDIALKQAELAESNTRNAVEKGIGLEGVLMTFKNQCQDRIFQASKTLLEAMVTFYQAQLMKYQTMATIYRTLIDGRIQEAKGIIEIYTANVQAFTSRVIAETSRLKAISDVYLSETEAYKADAQVYTAIADLDIKIFTSLIQKAVAKADILIKNAEMELKDQEVISGLKVEAMKTIATVLSQLVAGMMSAINASASVQGSGSTQTQTSYNYNYEE